jgi:hypothetical protein
MKYIAIIPIIIGVFRWRSALKEYRLLTIYCIACLVTEITNAILLKNNLPYFVVSNSFNLVEFVLLIQLFSSLDKFNTTKNIYKILLVIGIVFWLVENLLLYRLIETSSAAHLFYSGILIYVSVNLINQEMVIERRSIFSNPNFIISCGVLILFTYSVLYEVPYLLKLSPTLGIYWIITYIFWIINILVYLLFAIALLWIPTRRKFILPL